MNGHYVVIAEYKSDAPLSHETYLHKSSYDEAHERMKLLMGDNQIIRVAVAKLVFECGNETLLKGEN